MPALAAMGTPPDSPQFRLDQAASDGDLETVVALLDAGSPVDAVDEYGYTALHSAARNGHAAVVECLLKRGAAIDRGDGEQMTALVWAASHAHPLVVRVLLEHGAQPNLQDEEGKSALHWACSGDWPGTFASVKALVENGAPVDLMEPDGTTPLMEACASGLDQVVEYLVRHGADLNHCASYGATPLVQAIRLGRPRVIAILLDLGVDTAPEGGMVATAIREIAQYGPHESYDFRGALAVLMERGIANSPESRRSSDREPAREGNVTEMKRPRSNWRSRSADDKGGTMRLARLTRDSLDLLGNTAPLAALLCVCIIPNTAQADSGARIPRAGDSTIAAQSDFKYGYVRMYAQCRPAYGSVKNYRIISNVVTYCPYDPDPPDFCADAQHDLNLT